MLDFNSIAIGVLPFFSMEVKHPTGVEYASLLREVANFFELLIREKTDVKRVTPSSGKVAVMEQPFLQIVHGTCGNIGTQNK
ncbi:MAG: NAD(P)-binding domain-containing protein [Candidatus Nitronauta litoralis]|uniref:NAD(P)-binding domain-containing protein n=1 Tax=Candidatus Nitronauta litoralis TaxID=2705533 RepID=A0A7T0BYR6_9BACT|nr:MAG: NAD(P)-binding domain-containing protein [Candidatus Nitronauta litoralis]